MRRRAALGAGLALTALYGVAAAASAPHGAAEAPAGRSAAAAAIAGPAGGRLVLPHAGRRAVVRAKVPRVLRTDGYRGIERAPRTKPAPPPKPVVIGQGVNPDVLVDAAGTAHIVFNEDVNPPAPDVTHYCRLPRGARACENPSPTPMPIPIDYASDDAGPRIFQLGDQLVVLTHRYPPVIEHPDGELRDRTTYAWTSSDGGTTWTGPGIVGTVIPDGDATLVGGGGSKIAVITDAFTGGTYVQIVDAGGFTASRVQLGGEADAYEGSLVADGDGIVAAFANRNRGITVRRAPNVDAALTPDGWSSASIPGEDLPRLAGGPRGTFLLSHAADFRVRRIDGGQPQAPVRISPKRVAATRAFAADPAGRLYAAFVGPEDRMTATLRTSEDGRTWSGGFAVARAEQLDQLDLAAAEDGGGVLLQRRDPTSTARGTIAASPFGTLAPTGRPGAGSLAGSGIPGGFAGCKEAGFADVRLTPRAGCLLESRDSRYRGALVSNGEVDLNGLVLVPDAGVSIVFDPRRRTLDTTGRVRVLLRGPAIGDIELVHTELHVRLGAQAGQSLLQDVRLPAGPRIKGFPIDADFDVQIAERGVAIPVSLKLPPSLGGLSAAATLRAERGSGAVLDSFRLSAGVIPLGPVTMEGLVVTYDGTAERWSGEMGVKLPLGALKADVVFEGGAFKEGRFELRPPRPGILVFKETYFTGVRGGLGLDPVTIRAGASFGFLYNPPPADVFTTEVDGELVLTIRDGGAEFGFTGRGFLYGAQVGQWNALLTTDGFARLRGGYDYDLGIVAFDGSVDAFTDAPTAQFGGTFGATFRLFGVPINGGRGAFSNRGLGGCITAPPLPPKTFEQTEAGIGYEWGGSLTVLFGETCGLERYSTPVPAGRGGRRQAGPVAPFAIAGGVAWANVEVAGEGGAPAVDVIAPDGRRVTPLAPGASGGDARVSAVELPELARTIVVLDAPAKGAWQVVPREGSAAVSGVQVAQSTGALKVRGKVSRRGAGRVLRWTANTPAGVRLRFLERSKTGTRELGTGTGRRGTLRIEPGGGAGRRTIEAIPEREGLPGAPVRAATYSAPAPRRLAAPKGVRVRGATVRWRPVPGARGYLLTARLASGRTVALQAGRKARRAKVDGGRIRTVQIAARAPDGSLGRTAKGRGGR